jgi:TPR repeat protein
MTSKFLVPLLCAGCFCLEYLSAQTDYFDSSKIGVYQQECNSKIAKGCFYVGIAYFLGDGLEKNDAKAEEYLKIAYAIEPKNPSFAATLGRLYYYDYKIKGDNDLDTALKFFNEACDKGEQSSCNKLGDIYELGEDNIKVDLTKASAYYKKSCDLKNIDGCDKFRKIKVK